jgi:formylglycine-generating enzyme required for sulfatase activity
MTTEFHSCGLHCDRPGCIKAQRDQMRDRKPLTDKQIDAISLRDGGVTYRQFARAIEAHFGIGEKTWTSEY